MILTLEIPGWMPTPLNKLIGRHWGPGHKLKKHDREIIGMAMMAYGRMPDPKSAVVAHMNVKCRVDVAIILPPKQRAVDPDSVWKSLLDALVEAKVLVDDSPKWCQPGRVHFARGEYLVTYITITEE